MPFLCSQRPVEALSILSLTAQPPIFLVYRNRPPGLKSDTFIQESRATIIFTMQINYYKNNIYYIKI